MNSLQLQCWQSGAIPVLNASQRLNGTEIIFSPNEEIVVSNFVNNITEVKVVFIVHSETSGAVMKGRFEVAVDLEDGKFITTCSNETSVFIMANESQVLEIILSNLTNGSAIVYCYS